MSQINGFCIYLRDIAHTPLKSLIYGNIFSRIEEMDRKSVANKPCQRNVSDCVRQIFMKAILELNDEERDIVRIKFYPWLKIAIPKSDSIMKRAISAEACREFFNRSLPKSKMISLLPELRRDVALLSLCIGGINTVDLYELKKKGYNNGISGYKRAKTRHSRKDEAYMKMRIEPFIQDTFNKYLSKRMTSTCLFSTTATGTMTVSMPMSTAASGKSARTWGWQKRTITASIPSGTLG